MHRKAVCNEPGSQWKLEVAAFMNKRVKKRPPCIHTNFMCPFQMELFAYALNNFRCSARIHFQNETA